MWSEDDKKLSNNELKSNWLYNDIKWKCIPTENGINCDDIEVDRDGKYNRF